MKVNKIGCVGCGTCCSGICPANAIKLVDGKAEIDQSACLHCGTCASICPMQAISE